MTDSQSDTSAFFEKFEDSHIGSNELEKGLDEFPEQGQSDEDNKWISRAVSTSAHWSNYKKLCSTRGLSREAVKTLLARRKGILRMLASPATGVDVPAHNNDTTEPPKPVTPREREPVVKQAKDEQASPSARPAGSAIEDGLSEAKSLSREAPEMEEGGELPRGFEKLFGGKDAPLSKGRSAMFLELGNPMNSTADIYKMLAWCKKQRPNDLFDDYAVTMLAEPLPDAPIDNPVKNNLFEQTAWAKDNFSERRFRALIDLRDRLRKSGQLMVQEKPRPSAPSQEGGGKKRTFAEGSAGAAVCPCSKKVLVAGGIIVILVAGSLLAYAYSHAAPAPSPASESGGRVFRGGFLPEGDGVARPSESHTDHSGAHTVGEPS